MSNSSFYPEYQKPVSDQDKFVYAVSHDLQEPLRMMTSFMKLMESRFSNELPDDGKRYLKMIMENADRMKEMIYALVDFSRIKRTQEQVIEIDLQDLFSNIATMYARDFEQRNIEFNYDIPSTIDFRPLQFNTLVKVLVQNVLDHVGAKNIQLDISFEENDEEYHFLVSNSGEPLKKVYLDKVFEIFKKVDPSSDGVGAGLAIAREIVENHNGAMWATNELVTTIHFTVPKKTS